MITSKDIQKKEFTRGVRGYKEDEVDEYLDEISYALDLLIRENATLKENINSLSKEVDHYRGSENAVLSTLESAKALMADISLSAEKRADIVLKNAELDAERIRREAQDTVERLHEEEIALSRRWELFSARFKNLLETELERFNSSATELLVEGQSHTSKANTYSPGTQGSQSTKSGKTMYTKR